MSNVITRPQVDISNDVKELAKEAAEEVGQVIVHISVLNVAQVDTGLRIWPTTYLYDQGTEHQSNLIHAENIVYYPQWQVLSAGKELTFTLIFSGLPSSCASFDLIEHCTNQSGAFEVRDMIRNSSDVYYVKM